jgi:hypothetical protein
MGEYCCKNCFSDHAIKDFIELNDSVGTCDYCASENVHICGVKEVGEFIMEGVGRYYGVLPASLYSGKKFAGGEAGGQTFPSPPGCGVVGSV